MNFSTWPPVSTRRCSPVKNGWHFEQMSRRSSFWVEWRSEEHTSELQSQSNLVCRLLLEKKTERLLEQRQRDRALALQRIPVEGVQRGDLRAHVAIEVRDEVPDQLAVERDAARRGVRVERGGLVRVVQGAQLEHDSRREARAQIRPEAELCGRLRAARDERSTRAAQPVAQIEQGDLLRFAETGDVVDRGGFEFRGRRCLGKSAQKVGLAAPARSPEKDEALAVPERLAQRLQRRAVFSRRKIVQRRGRRRGELEQELLHRSTPSQAGGGHFI